MSNLAINWCQFLGLIFLWPIGCIIGSLSKLKLIDIVAIVALSGVIWYYVVLIRFPMAFSFNPFQTILCGFDERSQINLE